MTEAQTIDRDVADIVAEFAARRRVGPATPKHGEIADRLVAAILAKHNDGKVRMNVDRVAQGLDPYKLDEIKNLEVSHTSGCSATFIVIEVGMIGDEGTAASIFCRDYRHISIGTRGGLQLLNPKRGKRAKTGRFEVVHGLVR